MTTAWFLKTSIDNSTLVRKASDLVVQPKAVLVNKFTEDSVKKFIDDLTAAEDTGQPVIPVYIDSYGGQVYSLLAMVDAIKNCKTPVATIAVGKAMSCGAVLLTQGAENHRYMSPQATVMIHDVSSFAHGKVEEIKADAGETDRLNQLIYKLMSNNTGHPDDYFLKIVHERGHADWYLNAETCKEHNIVNHVRVPRFNLSVKVETEFG